MKLELVDMEKWNRKEQVNHFIEHVRCVMSITVDIDVTALVKAVKQQKRKFYPTFLYIVSKIVNSRNEFKMGYDKDGNVGVWDVVHPSYIIFNKDDESVTKIFTKWIDDFEDFYSSSCKDIEKHENTSVFCTTDIPINVFDVSCLPWIKYNSLDLHVFDSGTYLAPVITWGKYEDDGSGRVIMPLSMQIHHAVADGFHLSRFFIEVQELCNSLL